MQPSVVRLGGGDVGIPLGLGVGTWAWGESSQFTKATWGKSPGDSAAREAFVTSVEHGVKFFDTAEVYGNGSSERLLGEFCRGMDDVVIASKFLPLPYQWFSSCMERHLRGSLERLGLERIDLYQIHSSSASARSVECWARALGHQVEAGLVRAVGVSNFNCDEMRRAHRVLAEMGIQLASNQIEYSLLRRAPETETGVFQVAKELGISILAYSPLGMGRLSGKYTDEKQISGNRYFGKQPLAAIKPLVARLSKIGEAHEGASPAAVALSWCIAKGTIPIPGARNAAQAKSNAVAGSLSLSEEEVESLDKLSFVGTTSSMWQHG